MLGRTLWHKLPEELTERILSRLPITSILQCRCVCKQWKSLISSDGFAQLWEETAPRDFWFLVYHTCRVIAAYDPHACRWNNIPIYSLCSLDPSQVLPLASSGGLICFRNRNYDYPKLIVCNPLVGSRRVLPVMNQIRYIDIAGMFADRGANSYVILVTGTSEPTSNESITEVYDSKTGLWAHHCRSSQEFLQSWYEVHALWHEERFYCIATPGYRLIAYDMERREWMDLEVWLPMGGLKRPSLIICQGKLLLTGKLMDGYSSRSICIWELERVEGQLQWIMVGSMSEDMLIAMHFPYSTFVRCYGKGSLMCFTSNQGWQSVMYDIEEEKWHRLPDNQGCERSQLQLLGRNNLVGLSYEPSLLATA